ncbi:MAG: methylmalonyl Co-A mutase-associated GTPase MeaB [Xanthobacteraceae bacterium]|nr:methylmalonyl Co-A mutase-associated GTPase MeaB [Xanthobacteraceae bacterium]MCW5674091.1 methylmalonyl Co-A mutase-associated GTPase MeaB [Xanthobacteraceae bacterium]
MPKAPRVSPDIAELARKVLARDRAALARAITLVESKKSEHRTRAQELLRELLPETGKAIRVGISGVPGVGKSTSIDTLGSHLTAAGHRVAVLAVDPSSTKTGGSILGDKTRMQRLSADESAFIRPSPSAGTLGGVAARTRESMLLCEAAGYDVILVETVGIGQSEVAVAGMTDVFLVLMLPGAGDELQGIKKGILEVADIIAVNKADGDNLPRARAAASALKAAIHIFSPDQNEAAPVLIYSALTGDGIGGLWETVISHRTRQQKNGKLADKRRAQEIRWMWTLVEERFQERIRSDAKIRARVPALEKAVADGKLPPAMAADELAQLIGLSDE